MKSQEIQQAGVNDGNRLSGEESGELLQGKDDYQSLKKRARYFKWMLDEYMDNAYIADIETYELLYFNQAACKKMCIRDRYL